MGKRLRKQRLTQTELASALGITGATVSNLKRKGMPVDSVEAAREWREKNLNPRKEKRVSGSIGEETARLKAAQADIAEVEAAQLRGDLIDVEEVRYVFSASVVIFASQMDGLPGRVANELAAMSDPAQIRHRLRDEFRRIREAVSAEFRKLACLALSRPSGPAS